MKPTHALTPLLALLLTSLAPRAALAAQVPALLGDDDLAVPGDNPIAFCAKPDDHILTIHSIDLSPNPPKRGKPLSITANGTLHERVDDGATVHLQVKYGLIRLINEVVDLCEQVAQVDLKCPLEKGAVLVEKSVDVPGEVPPGKYTVEADVLSKGGDKITCLVASVVFPKEGGSFVHWGL